MKFLSVCSGIEAASVAWGPLGWEPVAFAEIEPFPCAVLAHHYPDTPNYGDMTKFQEWPDVAIDLLCGGTPCQSFSVAGLRGGLADPRGNLMLTFGAIAARYRPRWLVWENVPGVLSSNGGRDFGSFLGMLGQLGYGFAYRILDAQYTGLAQRRKRVFVVGCLGDWRRAAAVLFERHSLSGNPAPRREAGKTAPTIPSRSTAGGGLGTDFDCDGGLIAGVAESLRAQAQASHRADSETYIPLVSPALKARDFKGPSSDGDGDGDGAPLIAHALTGEGFDASEDGTGRGVPIVFGWQASPSQGTSTSTSPTLDKSKVPAVAQPYTLAIRGRGDSHDLEARQDGTANALLTPNGGRGGIGVVAIALPMQVRRLTPMECARLQGFPDDYLDITYRGKSAADGPKYKALGNSWAVPCARWVGERIEAVENISSRLKRNDDAT